MFHRHLRDSKHNCGTQQDIRNALTFSCEFIFLWDLRPRLQFQNKLYDFKLIHTCIFEILYGICLIVVRLLEL